MASPLGGRMSLDISDTLASIAKLNKSIKENESQWRADASQMDDWSSSQEGLEKRTESLTKQIEEQRRKVKEAQKLKELYIKQYGEESSKVQDANDKIIRYSKELERSQKELKSTNTSLEKLNAELTEQDKKTDKAEKSTKDLNKTVEKSDKSFGIATVAVGNFIANGLTAMVSAVGNAVSSLIGLTESTKEYRTQLATLTTMADQVGASGDYIIEKWMDVNAVLGDEQAAVEGMNNLMSAGFTAEKELDGITKALEGASLQWKDTLKFEGLADSLQEWIGSDGVNLTGNFAELLERLGYNLEDVTAQTKNMTDEQRRNWAIQTLNKEGLADVSDAYREANKDLIEYNKANSDLLNAQSLLGEAMEPFVTTVKQSCADIIYSFIDMTEGVEGAGDQLLYQIGYLAGSIYKNIKSAIEMMLPVVQSLIPKIIDFITTNLPSMVSQGVAIITSIIDGISAHIPDALSQISTMLINIIQTIVDNAPALLNSALTLFGQIVLAIPEITIQIAEAMPTLITSIMDGLWNGENSVYDTAMALLGKIVEAIPPLLDRLWQELPTIIDTISQSLSDAIPKVFDGAIVLLGQIVDAIPQIVVDLISNLPKIITSIINFLGQNGGKILSGAVELLMNIIFAIPEIVVEIGKKMPDIINGIINGLLAGTAGIFKAGYDLIAGLVDGMFDFDIVGKLKSLGSSIVGGIKSFFGIHSPSTVMAEEVGEPITMGIAEGMENATDEVIDVAEQTGEEIIGGFTEGWNDAINGTKKELVKSTNEAIEEVGNAVAKTAKDAGEGAGKALTSTVAETSKDYSKNIDIANDIFSVLKEGNTEDNPNAIADTLFDTAGQVGGIWGQVANSIWDFISNTLLGKSSEEVAETAKTMCDNLLNTILSLLNNMPQIIEGAITFLKNFAIGLIQGIPVLIQQLPRIISEMVTVLISEGIPALFEVGAELVKGLIQGMFSINLWDVVSNIGKGIVNGFKSLFGIRSPSRVMKEEIGKNLALGIEEGLTDNLKGVNNAIRNGIDTSVEVDQKIAGRKQVNVYQTNNYSQAHSRYEIYKSKRDTANAVKLALQGV